MTKRIVPLFLSVFFLVFTFVVPVFGASDYTILNYEDFVTQTDIGSDGTTVYITFPDEYFAYQTIDTRGTLYSDPGVLNGSLVINSAPDSRAGLGGYWPGSFMAGYFVDAENIPNGSKFSIGLDFWFTNEGEQAHVQNIVQLGIIYYDEEFQPCGYTVGASTSWEINSSEKLGYALTSSYVDKPVECKYLCYYATMNFRVLRSSSDIGTFSIDFEFYEPVLSMSIHDLTDLSNKLDKTNSLLDSIKNDTVNGNPPAGSDSIRDLEGAEDSLKNNTSAGRNEANKVISDAFEPILGNSSGLLFWTETINGLVGVGWFKGILTVSLALGIFGFLCNIVMVAGRSVARREASHVKSSKGG